MSDPGTDHPICTCGHIHIAHDMWGGGPCDDCDSCQRFEDSTPESCPVIGCTLPRTHVQPCDVRPAKVTAEQWHLAKMHAAEGSGGWREVRLPSVCLGCGTRLKNDTDDCEC